MQRTLNYAVPERRPRPGVPLLIVAALWWTAGVFWLIQQIGVLRTGPWYADDLKEAALAIILLLLTSVVLSMSLLARRIWATKAAMGIVGCAGFLTLLVGLTVGIKALLSSERLGVTAIIFGETLGIATIAALSAWLFRYWLRDIEAYEAEK